MHEPWWNSSPRFVTLTSRGDVIMVETMPRHHDCDGPRCTSPGDILPTVQPCTSRGELTPRLVTLMSRDDAIMAEMGAYG